VVLDPAVLLVLLALLLALLLLMGLLLLVALWALLWSWGCCHGQTDCQPRRRWAVTVFLISCRPSCCCCCCCCCCDDDDDDDGVGGTMACTQRQKRERDSVPFR